MKITTHNFGEIEFNEDIIINFNAGILGFEQLKKYLLIKADDGIFYWLNSVEDPQIAFPLIGSRIIEESYPEEKGHEAFGIVNLNSDVLKITVNLKAPVYINQDNKTGYQKILDTDKYPVNFNLFKE